MKGKRRERDSILRSGFSPSLQVCILPRLKVPPLAIWMWSWVHLREDEASNLSNLHRASFCRCRKQGTKYGRAKMSLQLLQSNFYASREVYPPLLPSPSSNRRLSPSNPPLPNVLSPPPLPHLHLSQPQKGSARAQA